MVWTKEMDLDLLKEIAAEGVMHQKPKSREKGSAWQKVVDNINSLPGYEVSCRSVRDRYNNMENKKLEWEKKKGQLEELIQINEESEQKAADESNAKEVLVNEDKAKAIEMRKRVMETMGETRSRTGEGSKNEKRRRSASQSFQWLQEAIRGNKSQATTGRRGKKSTRRRKKRKGGREKRKEGRSAEKETSDGDNGRN